MKMKYTHAAGRLAAVTLAGVMGVTSLGATAAHGAIAQDHLVSADPIDTTPQIIGDKVRQVATVGGIHVAVGEFEQVRQNDGTTFARHNIVAFDDAGNVVTTFDPQFNGSEIYDVIPSGDGSTVYVAGSFSKVDGANAPRVTRINVTTGARVTQFRPNGINNAVRALILNNGVLYAGGRFTRVGGVDRPGLVALDPTTGLDTGQIALPVTGTWNGGVTSVDKMTIKPDGTKLVFIGNFRYVAGQYRPQIAMVDLSPAGATLDSWQTLGYAKTCSSTFETYMYDVDSDPTGTYFVAVTTGAYSGGPGANSLCDAAARFEWGAAGPNQTPSWVEYSGGDTFTAVEITGEAIYVGGHFRWMNNPYASDRPGTGAVSRKGLAALDPRNGLPLKWNPGRLRGWGVWGFNAEADGLWMGHDTDSVGGETHELIAKFPLDGGDDMPVENTGSLPGEMVLLGSTDAQALTFDGATVTSTRSFTSNADWSTARAPFMIDNRVYYGMPDGTFKSRSFNNATTFGSQTGHNIYKDTSWAGDLKVITSATYDRVQGRLYYTLAGSNTLYYRYFTPQHPLAGAMRFTVNTTGTGITWSSTTGMVIAGGQLYVRDNTGTLRKLAWNNGPSGAATAVSGPAIDGVNWSSRLMFLRTSS